MFTYVHVYPTSSHACIGPMSAFPPCARPFHSATAVSINVADFNLRVV